MVMIRAGAVTGGVSDGSAALGTWTTYNQRKKEKEKESASFNTSVLRPSGGYKGWKCGALGEDQVHTVDGVMKQVHKAINRPTGGSLKPSP